MEGIKDVMNSAVSAQGTTSKRIAGDAGREYVLQKDAVVPADRKASSGGLQPLRSQSGQGSGALGSGPLGKPPLPPDRKPSQVCIFQAVAKFLTFAFKQNVLPYIAGVRRHIELEVLASIIKIRYTVQTC